jgi:tyrosine decarboxylase / aspartate 1-decarboxylase
MHWESQTFDELKDIVFNALVDNNSFHDHNIMGLPATYLDPKIFPKEASFLSNTPYIKCFIENPNHIGLHTYHTSLPTFKGTQKIELDLLKICAEKIFKAKTNSYDGYVAPGGTECNIQALWVFREYFKNIFNAKNDEIAVLFSEDTHYSAYKACNLLQLNYTILDVNFENRNFNLNKLDSTFRNLENNQIKYIISILNMGTTMFGSVDSIDNFQLIIDKYNFNYKIHIDAAFGGFIYPIINEESNLNFENSKIDSISIDAHKMLQAPYGTGIFMIRKGLINNVLTKKASYIEGNDQTLCGSRSGANAVATWMILNIYGSKGLKNHMSQFIEKTDYICNVLDQVGIRYFRNKNMNLISIRSEDISDEICEKYTLVPNSHNEKPTWWKIVVMEHVNWDLIFNFLKEVTKFKNKKNHAA